MNSQFIDEWLAGLSLAERAKALNLVSFRLTVHAREYGVPSEPEAEANAARKLLGINELQHKLAAQIGHYLDGDESTAYPVGVFSRILQEAAEQYGIAPVLNAAVVKAKATA